MAADPRVGADEAGFTLVEHVVAITVIAGVLLSLLSVLGAGMGGVLLGRQRTIATSLGKGAIERFQGAYYDQTSFESNVGMNSSESGLLSDSRLTADPLTGQRLLDGRALVGVTNPVFSPYQWDVTDSSTTFHVAAYVTASGVVGDRSRMLTVYVAWAGARAQPLSLRFVSAASPLDYATYPASDGSADVPLVLSAVTSLCMFDSSRAPGPWRFGALRTYRPAGSET